MVSHLVVALLVFAVSAPGLGYRVLWQDELSTAEGARTVCESGVPRVVDEAGAVSLNAGGRELQDGDLLREQPWPMMYLAAGGLCAAEALGLEPDAAVRLPFVVVHATTSALASWALVRSAGAPLLLANGIGVALGIQSVRLAHDRTARYHALLDFLAVAGVVALGAVRRGRRTGRIALVVVILALPQVHWLSGSALALGFGLTAALLLAGRIDRRSDAYRRILLVWVATPGALALVGVLALSRPWALSWGRDLEWPGFTGLGDLEGILYALVFWLGCGVWLRQRGRRRLATTLLWSWGIFVLVAVVADIHELTRPRYFLALGPLALLWPAAFGLDGLTAGQKRRCLVAVLLASLTPELALGWLPLGDEPPFSPFHGVRLVADDVRRERQGTRQPVEQAVEWLRRHAAPEDPILFDYVPQYATWYLPGHPVALMPDGSFRGGLNADHPVWSRPLTMPRWHLWYPEIGSGPWGCRGRCDFGAERYEPETGRYLLRSRALGATVAMCRVRVWRTHRWNNAPFKNLEPDAFRPRGDASQSLLLAAPCEAVRRQGRRASAVAGGAGGPPSLPTTRAGTPGAGAGPA